VSKDVNPSSDVPGSLSSVQVCHPVQGETSLSYPSQVQVCHSVQDETSISCSSLLQVRRPVEDETLIPYQVSRPVEEETPILPDENEDEPLMYVAGYVKGRKFDVLIDSGASASYINSEVVKRLKIPTTKKKEVTTVAFGKPSWILGSKTVISSI